MKITNETYFELNNKGLSQSKIKDYIIDPNYCYRKNISGKLKKDYKQAWNIGSAIDDILTEKDNMSSYAVLSVPLGEKATYFMTKVGKAYKQSLIDAGQSILSVADYNLIIEVTDAVEQTSAWKQIKKEYTFQEILEVPMELGEHFDCLYGKPDAYKINKDGVCDLLDVKTTASLPVDLATGEIALRKYMYSALDFGYFIQLWFYGFLLKSKYPQIKSFRYWHLTAEKKEPYHVELFRVDDEEVEKCEDYIMTVIDKIAGDKDFAKRDTGFDNFTKLGWFTKEDDITEEEFNKANK